MSTKKRKKKPDVEQKKETSDSQSEANLGEDTTLAIIKLLQQDGRMSYANMAKNLNLSEGAIRKRVIQLLEDQVISIVAEADPKAFGYNLTASITIEPAPGVDIDVLAQYFCDLSEVTYVAHFAGEFNLTIDTYLQNTDELHDFLNKHIHTNKDITRYSPMIKLKVYKMRPKWHEMMLTNSDQN